MADPTSIQPFAEFVRSLSSARHQQFAAAPDANVESVDAFNEMKQHLLSLYEGMEARHTFLERGGQIVDCIPIEQQPSLRDARQRILTPPSMSPRPVIAYEASPDDVSSDRVLTPPPQLHPDYQDRFGNRVSCPEGTIPMVRVTLERISRFKNLQEFFQKAPRTDRYPDRDVRGKLTPFGGQFQHRHAHAHQFVRNHGGTSVLNVWKPFAGVAPAFSLSQQWYVGGSGDTTQTVECGWQVSRQIHGTDEPCLFIFSTPDNYTTGCYDLTCNAFVQTNPAVVIGGTLVPSQPGGPQFEYRMGYFLDGRGWWLHFNEQWVGYYPVALFRGGPLASGAAIADFGGETVRGQTWPPMGSGAFPSAGFGHAAYQRAVACFPPRGGTIDAQLTPTTSSPNCYQIQLVNTSATAWGTYLYFGGPGGSNC